MRGGARLVHVAENARKLPRAPGERLFRRQGTVAGADGDHAPSARPPGDDVTDQRFVMAAIYATSGR